MANFRPRALPPPLPSCPSAPEAVGFIPFSNLHSSFSTLLFPMAHVSPNRESRNPDAKTTMDIAQSSLSLSPFPEPNEAKVARGQHQSCPVDLLM